MGPEDVAAARALLRAELSRAIVFGSFGLVLHGVYDAALVKDVDVIATLDDTLVIAGALVDRGYVVRSWDVVRPRTEITRERLAGRIYVRATREDAAPRMVDVTYEGIDVALWRTDAVVIDGITVGTVARIERQRESKRAEG